MNHAEILDSLRKNCYNKTIVMTMEVYYGKLHDLQLQKGKLL